MQNEERKANKRKIINDPVYGFVTFRHDHLLDLIDHPYFQRLRRIYALFLGSIPKVARIGGGMLGIVNLHGPRIDRRLQRRRLVRQGRHAERRGLGGGTGQGGAHGGHVEAAPARGHVLVGPDQVDGAGLRVGEAIRLNLCDVDLEQRIITVRDTKFYKTRLVPIGPRLASKLRVYLRQRCALALPLGQDSALLCTRTGHRLNYQYVITLFQRVRLAAGIARPTGELRPPRLHDLRHTAAVHRVLEWYRAGKDVQRLLPQLATYLGHVDIRSTQRYLRMTPELLHEASRRFAIYSGQEIDHE